MLDMALNAVRFFRNESCGSVFPAAWVPEDDRHADSVGRRENLEPGICNCWKKLSTAMKMTSDLRAWGRWCPCQLSRS